MPPLASRASVEAYSGISPKLMIVIVALFVAFLVFIICFFLPANKTSCPSASGRCQCGPESRHASHCAAAHRRPVIRRGLVLPTATIARCSTCKNAPRAVDKASRLSREPVCSPAIPLPYHYGTGRCAPTGVLPAAQALPRRSASSAPSSSALPTTPRSPSLGYATRGPTATVRPVVW